MGIDLLTAFLICVPLFWTNKFSFSFGMGFDILLHILLIIMCCIVKRTMNKALKVIIFARSIILKLETFAGILQETHIIELN